MEIFVSKIIEETERLKRENRQLEAVFLLENVIKESLNILGVHFINESNLPKALHLLSAGLVVDPTNWVLWNNTAHILNGQFRFAEAQEAALKACSLCNYDTHDPYYNCGVIYGNVRDYENAIKFYQIAIKLNPAYSIIQYNMSTAMLCIGQYEEGWKYYEARFESFPRTKEIKERFKQPIWSGQEDLRGKKILVYIEQGIGDLIQFMRFVPLLKDRGAIVYVECQRDIADLVRHAFSNDVIDEVIPRSAGPDWPKIPDTDFVVSVCSLALAMGINDKNIPTESYFSAPVVPLPAALTQKTNKLKVGITWGGNPDHTGDALRSVHLSMFRDISNLPFVKLFSFQMRNNVRTWNKEAVNLLEGSEGIEFVDLALSIRDWQDTAAYLEHIDLLITIDSGIAHLAGAMGKPVWNLIPYLNDWRWGVNQKSSIWYPQMRLFQQPSYRDWDSVFKDVIEALKEKHEHIETMP